MSETDRNKIKSPYLRPGSYPIAFLYIPNLFRYEQIMLMQESAGELSKALMKIIIEQNKKTGLHDGNEESFIVPVEDTVVFGQDKDIKQYYTEEEIVGRTPPVEPKDC